MIDRSGQSYDGDPRPIHWPSIPAVDAEVEWNGLREWVEVLKFRFPALDHHVIPACWWQHNEHVETLCALRDHERASFSETASRTGPMEWLRALRDAAEILARWTGELTCGALHQELPAVLRATDYGGWTDHWHADQKRRDREEIAAAAAGGDTTKG